MTSQPSSRRTSVDQPVFRHVFLYFPSYSAGGVKKMRVNLAHGLSDAGIKADCSVPLQIVPSLSGLKQKVQFITPAHLKLYCETIAHTWFAPPRYCKVNNIVSSLRFAIPKSCAAPWRAPDLISR